MSEKLTRQRLRTSGVTVIISLSMVLFMLGVMGILVINARKLSHHFKENIGFQIMLKDTATSAQTDLLIRELNSAPYTKQVRFVSKEQAAANLKQDLGEDFISLLGTNPLLNTVELKFNADHAHPDTLKKIERSLLTRPFVKEVVYHKVVVEKLNKNTRIAALFIFIFSCALFVVAIALINNTIRLSIYAQRFLIRTMYLVGATRGFISKPFVLRGCRQGIIAGIIAGLMLAGFLALGAKFLPDVLHEQDENVLLAVFGGIIVLGIVISAFSAMFSVNRYLRLKTSDLYF